ncbi:TfoX/Sxy family protein [Roseospira goensis]|uniref:TfoX N-terminal domain-containing protein n=1 Tax=Roseospira goensis TaxID=391922 RepID=A0A7W6WJN8_9PROT|nr:TfoX/Sxy family protein [Roseospira goensis]MBB4284698.1 hypothetical protein [Roseospira goensis]
MTTLARAAHVADAVLPLLRAALGGVETRHSGATIGLYLKGTLFGVIQDGVLLFRVDARTRAAYDAAERDADTADDTSADTDSEKAAADIMTHFEPPGGGALVAASFRRVPPFVLDDEDMLADWGRAAWEAGKRARAAAGS